MKAAAVVKALGDLHAAGSPRELIHWALNDLGARLGCDFAVWTQISPQGEMRSAALAEGIDGSAYQYGPVIQAYLRRDHPVIRAYMAAGGGRQAGRLTDYVTQAAFDETGLCRDAYRHLSMRRQLALIFRGPDGGMCTFAFGRAGRNFSGDHSRAASDFALHLQLLFGRLWHIEALERDRQSSLAARFRAVRRAGTWYFAFADEPTAELVRRHFGDPGSFVVPQALAEHFSADKTAMSRAMTDNQGARWLLDLTRQNADEVVATVRRAAGDAATVLTLREREILHWIAKGKRDGEIALILGISLRTVHKHVEHILAKLGVETRGAAVAAAAPHA